MIIKKSPLDLEDFVIVNNKFQFKPKIDEMTAEDVFDKYVVDIDYMIRTDDELSFQIFVKMDINKSEEQSGYVIFVEGIGFFNFDETVTNEEKLKFLNFSGLPICINNLRNFVSLLTTHASFGRYLLPAIDVNDLLLQKSKKVKSHKKVKVKK